MNVSIIVPVYNAERSIKKCIGSLLNLDYTKSKYEIIFIDDASMDNTKRILEDCAEKHKNIKIFEQLHKGPAAARNLGITKANGKIIFFTDSDCVVPRNWITNMQKYLDNNNIGAVGGSLKPVSSNSIYEIFDQKRRENLYGCEKKFVDALPTCNLAVRKGVLEEIEGFDESFEYASAEDYELCYRIRKAGYKILYAPEISVLHYHSQNLKSLLRRGYTHGREFIKLRRKHEGNRLNILKILLISFVMPLATIRKYPLGLSTIAILYETSASLGGVVGLWRYVVKNEHLHLR